MSENRVKTYVWEFPVRLAHWLKVLCILALSITGYYIGNPFIYAISSEQYIMGWIRFIHFVAAYVFLMSIIIRIYWAFVGNKYSSFSTLFPFSRRALHDMGDDIKTYCFIDTGAKCHVGHTALAGLSYLVISCIFLFEVFSGFALYSVTHSGAIWTLLGGWMLGVMALPTIRLWHHLLMYVILAFAIVHFYIVWFAETREKSGIMLSIFTGYKFIPEKDPE